MFNYNYPMSTPSYSLSDIAAASGNGYRNNDGGMWGDGAWWMRIWFRMRLQFLIEERRLNYGNNG